MCTFACERAVWKLFWVGRKAYSKPGAERSCAFYGLSLGSTLEGIKTMIKDKTEKNKQKPDDGSWLIHE